LLRLPKAPSLGSEAHLKIMFHLNNQIKMSKFRTDDWKVVIKIIITLATAILGALGAKELGE